MYGLSSYKAVLSIYERGEEIGEGETFAFSPMFLNLVSFFISSHYCHVLCFMPSPPAHMHPIIAFSLWLETRVEAKGTSLSEDLRKHRDPNSFCGQAWLIQKVESIPTFMMSMWFVRLLSWLLWKAKEIYILKLFLFFVNLWEIQFVHGKRLLLFLEMCPYA